MDFISINYEKYISVENKAAIWFIYNSEINFLAYPLNPFQRIAALKQFFNFPLERKILNFECFATKILMDWRTEKLMNWQRASAFFLFNFYFLIEGTNWIFKLSHFLIFSLLPSSVVFRIASITPQPQFVALQTGVVGLQTHPVVFRMKVVELRRYLVLFQIRSVLLRREVVDLRTRIVWFRMRFVGLRTQFVRE